MINFICNGQGRCKTRLLQVFLTFFSKKTAQFTLKKIWILFFFSGFVFFKVSVAETVSREYQLKTAYLFNLAELTEWPNGAATNLCLLGQSPIKDYLPVLEGQLINGKPVHVNITSANLSDCTMIYITTQLENLNELLELAKFNHILLVSDIDKFAEKGGMVEILLQDNKLKFLINITAIKNAGLKVSSKLLRMSEIVE